MSNLDGKITVKPHIWMFNGRWICKVLTTVRCGWGKTPEDAYYSWKNS